MFTQQFNGSGTDRTKACHTDFDDVFHDNSLSRGYIFGSARDQKKITAP